jgi:ABC-type polysaccharide/polyol phosphate transport system ATPase subunit
MSICNGRPAIVFEDVWKSFPHHAGQMLIRDRLANLLRRNRQPRFQALQCVSFTVQHGESVAIVGHNGAGKSTLLNVATGLCLPDRGRVRVEGRVAPLLELGSGFHPDLTGAENLCINAALLGLKRRELAARFDEIVAFSEIGNFIQEPLRTYSTGMVMRLAFSVAVHVDPDVLIIDEVLAVGDMAFSRKSNHKIREFRDLGKTILCVSHATAMLPDLCSRGIWLDHGQVIEDGPIKAVLDAYSTAQLGRTQVMMP